MTKTVQKLLATQKIGLIDGINSNVSCGQCGQNSVHKFGDLTEKEEVHEALNLKTGEMEKHYKLSYYCAKSGKVVLGAVVWNHEIPGVEA